MSCSYRQQGTGLAINGAALVVCHLTEELLCVCLLLLVLSALTLQLLELQVLETLGLHLQHLTVLNRNTVKTQHTAQLHIWRHTGQITPFPLHLTHNPTVKFPTSHANFWRCISKVWRSMQTWRTTRAISQKTEQNNFAKKPEPPHKPMHLKKAPLDWCTWLSARTSHCTPISASICNDHF